MNISWYSLGCVNTPSYISLGKCDCSVGFQPVRATDGNKVFVTNRGWLCKSGMEHWGVRTHGAGSQDQKPSWVMLQWWAFSTPAMAQGHVGALLNSFTFFALCTLCSFFRLQPPIHRHISQFNASKAPPVSLVKFHIQDRGAQNELCSETEIMRTKNVGSKHMF